MGYQESFIKFKDEKTLVQELRRYEKGEKDSDLVHIVCVDRVKKQVSPFNEGELVVVAGGERSQQRDKNRLQKELGIKNIVDIVFIDNPFYWEMAEEKGIDFGDFLKEHFESLSENEYEELFKNEEEIIMQINQSGENTQQTNIKLQMELAMEKLGHIRKILELSSGIDIVIGLNEGEYSLFQDCDNCGGYHLLETYSTEEAVALVAETEAEDLIEMYFTE
ncbi:hypothetical protein [Lysinibacillus boronitolerans]|uniref:hypothetical protein n=1 Tax=Lysinibacillus boronitolerans TaxID=309788 RepID=UPI003852E1DD